VSRYLRTPQIADQLSGTKQRVDSLERRLGQTIPNPNPYEVTFSQPGAVQATESGRARHPWGGRLVSVDAHLGTAGSTGTVIAIKRSGISVGSLTIPSSSTFALRGFDSLFSAYQQVLTVEVTTAGTGAEDLTVFCVFDR
jgi:hypothetical protein